MIMYKGMNPEGGSVEVFNLKDIPTGWEYSEFEIEDPRICHAENEVDILRNQTKIEISALIFEHTQKLMMRGVPIPEEIQIEYDLKRAKYKEQKQAIYEKYGITINP